MAYRVDLACVFVLEAEVEGFFAAEDDVYGVETHGFRVARRLVPPMRDGAEHGWGTRPITPLR